MKIAIASDHRGIEYKSQLVSFLKSKAIEVDDLGTMTDEAVDYPDYALKVCEAVRQGKAQYGIVICHSGIGVSVTANKVKGIRAALCQVPEQGELARRHTDANILALPAGFVKLETAQDIIMKFLNSKFEGGRHQRRLEKIQSIEEKTCQ